METFQRTQIYLKKNQLQHLRTRASRQQKTVSDLIRMAIDRTFEPENTPPSAWKNDPLTRLIGKGKGLSKNLSREVDWHLYGIPPKK